MCGVTGCWWLKGMPPEPEMVTRAKSMADAITHRGPDDGGIFVDPNSGVALAHRRLAIIDLSPNGHQPMVSSCGRYVLAYNGEIYNAAELRADLEKRGRQFRGHSDTEVIVEQISAHGIESVTALNGIFAFAVWDREQHTLSLVRDHVGIKPMYFGLQGRLLLFGSELKSITAHDEFQPRLNRDAVAAFLRHNYIPAPLSIYQGIQKAKPGCITTIDQDGEIEQTPYWSLASVVSERIVARYDETALVEQLHELLGDAVKRQMVSDVPLGGFLSGGIDSSTVVALMQRGSDRPVKTFSIGFEIAGYNEATHAKAIAERLATEHHEWYLTAQDALDVIPSLASMYDEPFADSSQIPTSLVSAMTKKHVTVALSGDGGDELFAGYNRYLYGEKMINAIRRTPPGARAAVAALISATPPGVIDFAGKVIPSSRRPRLFADKVKKAGDVLRGDTSGIYRSLISHWPQPNAIVREASEPKGILWDPTVDQLIPDPVERMQYLDTLTYMPDDILVKVDRASMAHSLEVRVPFLDPRVIEFAWRMPLQLKMKGGRSKWPLTQILECYVPRKLIDRPKMGFGVPIDSWLRGDLKDWAADLLDPAALDSQGLLNVQPITEKWREHQTGKNDWHYWLWDILMLQAWLRENPKVSL
ncbi:MAG: asparagine synthase (glutamine-hydrolyzing) [Pseudomonadota bacterium]